MMKRKNQSDDTDASARRKRPRNDVDAHSSDTPASAADMSANKAAEDTSANEADTSASKADAPAGASTSETAGAPVHQPAIVPVDVMCNTLRSLVNNVSNVSKASNVHDSKEPTLVCLSLAWNHTRYQNEWDRKTRNEAFFHVQSSDRLDQSNVYRVVGPVIYRDGYVLARCNIRPNLSHDDNHTPFIAWVMVQEKHREDGYCVGNWVCFGGPTTVSIPKPNPMPSAPTVTRL
jgi:hypothetical protein